MTLFMSYVNYYFAKNLLIRPWREFISCAINKNDYVECNSNEYQIIGEFAEKHTIIKKVVERLYHQREGKLFKVDYKLLKLNIIAENELKDRNEKAEHVNKLNYQQRLENIFRPPN